MRITHHLPVAALAALALTSPAQAANAARGAVAPASTFLVHDAVRGSDLRDLGRASAATRVGIVLLLRYRNQGELDQLVRLQSDRRSPFFHHYLRPAQFAAEFSPTPADYRHVALALGAAGFTVEPGAANRTLIAADAPAPVAERFFGTEIHRLAQAGYGVRYANVTKATLPAFLAPAVRSFEGVDDVVRIRTHHLPAVSDSGLPDAAASSQATDASPDLSGPIERKSNGAFAGLFPTGIAKAYRFPIQAGGYTGVGSPIGIVIDSDIKNSDLTAFWTAAKITRTGGFYRVNVSGKDPGVTQDLDETAIDTETASSLAPGADIYLYLIPTLGNASIEKAYNEAVADDSVGIVSSSFGGCEKGEAAFADATNAIAEQGGAEGITFTASTGDAGGDCQGNSEEPDVVNSPASGTYFIAVGATTLKVNASTGARTSETAWGPGGSSGGGGGGVSDHFPIEDYQAAISGMAVNPLDGFAGRNLPDIALDGSNKTGSYVAIYLHGAWAGYGGTSVSNPMFAAFLADENQEVGSDQGFFSQYLYQYFAAYGYGSFYHDITSGSIGAGWKATAGYDQATGIGSIDGATGTI
jgi:subtilase family serine protease